MFFERYLQELILREDEAECDVEDRVRPGYEAASRSNDAWAGIAGKRDRAVRIGRDR